MLDIPERNKLPSSYTVTVKVTKLNMLSYIGNCYTAKQLHCHYRWCSRTHVCTLEPRLLFTHAQRYSRAQSGYYAHSLIIHAHSVILTHDVSILQRRPMTVGWAFAMASSSWCFDLITMVVEVMYVDMCQYRAQEYVSKSCASLRPQDRQRGLGEIVEYRQHQKFNRKITYIHSYIHSHSPLFLFLERNVSESPIGSWRWFSLD